jgi:hypothetical protein
VKLDPVKIPSLFVTGTDTGVGKTVIAGAIASWFGACIAARDGSAKMRNSSRSARELGIRWT